MIKTDEKPQLVLADKLLSQARGFLDEGAHAKAGDLLEEALLLQETALGPEHPDTLRTLGIIADVLGEQKQYEAAFARQMQVLDAQLKTLGDRHEDVALSFARLAGFLRCQGRYEEALGYMMRALDLRQLLLGPENQDTRQSMADVALLLTQVKDFGRALPLLQEAVALKEKVLGPMDPETIRFRNNLDFFRLLGEG